MNDCAAARHNLFVDTNGEVRICCNNLTHLDHSDLGSALQGSQASRIRHDIESGFQPRSCGRCWQEEQQSGRSYRLDYISMYPHLNDREVGLRTLQLQAENTCNLSCVYCGPAYSSRWEQILSHGSKKRNVPMLTDEDLVKLEMLTLAGGEPSLIKSNVLLLKRLLIMNQGCEIVVNTNLTTYQNNPLWELLKQFPNVKIIVSFESVGDRFEYIRHPAQWSVFKSNWHLVTQDFGRVEASMILFPLTILAIQEAIYVASCRVPQDRIFINPYHGTAVSWSDLAKSRIDYLRWDLIQYSQSLLPSLRDQLLEFTQHMYSDRDITHMPGIEKIDEQRGISHRDIFGELYE
jgi:4Fe-4S single cluster domain